MESATDTPTGMMERFAEVLRKAGVKVTQQRLEIYREVAGSVDHPDIETVFQSVRKRMPTVSLDTVYRTLALFEELGLVSTVRPREERARFDANMAPHHHFVCVRCGLTRDVYDARLDNLDVPTGTEALGDVQSTHVEFRGLCSDCARKAAGHASKRAETA